MSNFKKLMMASAGGEVLNIEDVFSTYLYTGTGSTQTITNGIDLSGEGGLVWIKSRSATSDHQLFDTTRGATKELISNRTSAEATDADTLTTFNANGFSIGADATVNTNAATYGSWTFRKDPKFFDVVTYTGTGSAQTISHSLEATVGCLIVKRTDTTSNWAVYHSGNTANPETDHLHLNLTDATVDDATHWNDTAPTSSVFTVGTNTETNASGGSYVAYLFASLAGITKMGSYTGNGTTQNIDCGFSAGARFVLIKRTDASEEWHIFDTERGINAGDDPSLRLNKDNAEFTSAAINPYSAGFQVEQSATCNNNVNNATYIFYAIA